MKNIFFALLTLFLFTSCGGDSQKFHVKLDKSSYTPGETITVDFVADATWEKNAWIGIIPSKIEHGKEHINDMHDVAYKYLENKGSGTLSFKAPMTAGSFDMRLNDSDAGTADGSKGKEIHSVTFQVK